MKRFLFLFAIFLILICISSFSWAFSQTIICDLSDFGLSNEYAITFPSAVSNYEDLTCMYIRDYGNNMLLFCFSEQPMYYSTSTDISKVDGSLILNGYIDTTTGTYYIETNDYNQMTTFDMGFSNNYLKMGNAHLYSDSALTDIVTPTNYVYDINLIAGGNNQEEEEEEENFFADFWTNLIHIIVPNEEDWEELQDSFQDDILDKFQLTSMSFNDNLEFQYSDSGLWRPTTSAPTISFGSLGTIDLSYFNDFLNTPLSFGSIATRYGDNNGNYTIPTNRCYFT